MCLAAATRPALGATDTCRMAGDSGHQLVFRGRRGTAVAVCAARSPACSRQRRPSPLFFLFVFSVSVVMGSVFVNQLLKGEVSGRYVPISAFALAAFLIDLGVATHGFHVATAEAGIGAFVASPGSWRNSCRPGLDRVFFGGMFVVPLYAVLQTQSAAAERSRMIAANNIVNAAVTVVVVAVVTLLLASGASVPVVIGAIGIATLAVAVISCWMLPDTVARAVLRARAAPVLSRPAVGRGTSSRSGPAGRHCREPCLVPGRLAACGVSAR